MDVHADRQPSQRIDHHSAPCLIIHLGETRDCENGDSNDQPQVLYPLVQIEPLDLRTSDPSYDPSRALAHNVHAVMENREQHEIRYEDPEEEGCQIRQAGYLERCDENPGHDV